MKRILLLGMICAISIVTMAGEFRIGQFTFKTLSDYEVSLHKVDYTVYSVQLTESISYQGKSYTITSIADNACLDCKYLVSVVIPNTVTKIGKNAFANTPLFSNPANWDDYALYIDDCLISVKKDLIGDFHIKENTRLVAEGAFDGCQYLTGIHTPQSVSVFNRENIQFHSISLPKYDEEEPDWQFEIGGIGFYTEYFYGYSPTATIYEADSTLTSVVLAPSITYRGVTLTIDQIGADEGEHWLGPFNNLKRLTSVVLPSGLKRILYPSFALCPKLSQIKLPEGLQYIGWGAFNQCPSLDSINIPSSVEVIGTEAFEGAGLYNNNKNWSYGALYIDNCLIKVDENYSGHFKVREGTRLIANSAFKDCKWLTSVSIPYGVTEIGVSAFRNCSSLKSITIPSSVKNIRYQVFANCKSLSTVTLESVIDTVESSAFYKCSSLQSITGSLLRYIADEAFRGCQSLESIDLSMVTDIEYGAFDGCSSLYSIYVPYDLNSLGSGVFVGTAFYNDQSNWSNSALYLGDYLIAVKSDILGDYQIRDNTRMIADGAFSDCKSLTSVTIPSSVEKLDDAFSDCPSLSSITIQDGVKEIRSSALAHLHALTSIKIPNSVEKIGRYAFYDCPKLSNIELGSGVQVIDEYAFNECKSLVSITLPEGLKELSDGIFYKCSSLASINIPNSVTRIGYSAFGKCDALTSVVIPASVNKIEDNAFGECRSLQSIQVDAQNQTYDSRDNCNAIIETKTNTLLKACNSTVIPKSVRKFANDAFNGCFALTSINIPNGMTVIPSRLFSGCKSLTSVSIPNSVTYIGYSAFRGCSSLSSVVIPSSVTRIENEAFYGCSNLRSVVIPSSVTEIGEEIFSNCRNLQSITITANSLDEYTKSSVNELLYNAKVKQPRVLVIDGKEITDFVVSCTDTDVKASAFVGYPNITITITTNSVEEYCRSTINKQLYDANVNNPRKLLINGQEVKDLVIPGSVDKIARDAFRGITSIQSVVWEISDYSDEKSCNHIFESIASGIKSFVFTDGVTSIPSGLLDKMHRLESLTIPCSLKKFDSYAFAGLNSLQTLNITAREINEFYASKINRKLYNSKVKVSRKLLIDGIEVKELMIPAYLTQIENHHFYGLTGVDKIYIPTNVKRIGEGAFEKTGVYNNQTNWEDDVLYIDNCLILSRNTLDKYTIKEGTRLIADAAFKLCTQLKSVKFPKNSLTTIGAYAFRNCSLIKSVKLPKSVLYKEYNSFSGSTDVK